MYFVLLEEASELTVKFETFEQVFAAGNAVFNPRSPKERIT